jgi:ADP-ribosylglycohydrolase
MEKQKKSSLFKDIDNTDEKNYVKEHDEQTMEQRYRACMILHSTGDTIGFGEGYIEFNEFRDDIDYNYSNEMVFKFISYGGINDLLIDNWQASDDTVLHIATGLGLLNSSKKFDINDYGKNIADEYLKSMNNLNGRYPGKMTVTSLKMLKAGTEWNEIPYAIPGTGDGNGAVIRASCIGLAFYKEDDLDKLIAVSIESARITHNSVIGYLGTLNISYFISLAIRNVHYSKWSNMFIELLESKQIDVFLEKSGRGIKEYNREKNYCISLWNKYNAGRFTGKNIRYQEFMINPAYRNKYYADNFGLPRDTINTRFYFAGKGALDCVIIAYDAFVDSMMNSVNPSWEKLIIYSAIHSGDSDSTGAVAGSLWGAYNGFGGVPKNNYSKLEYLEELDSIGKKLYKKYY